jgi:hypothetical protein
MARRINADSSGSGSRVIKVCATGGVCSFGDSVGGQQLSLEEMKTSRRMSMS